MWATFFQVLQRVALNIRIYIIKNNILISNNNINYILVSIHIMSFITEFFLLTNFLIKYINWKKFKK